MISNLDLPVKYSLTHGEVRFDLSPLIGTTVKLQFTGKIICGHCGKQTKKSYSQGYCFSCTMKLASCDLCIMKPETCHFDKGTCREPEWGQAHCMQPHVVYLANSSGLKVGITRRTQVPTRWIDQGATQAMPIIEVQKRITSGLIEVLFKKHIADRTDWRKMLKGPAEEINLLEWKEKLLDLLKEDLKGHEYTVLDEPEYKINYPVSAYPEKVSSINLDKVSEVHSRLVGIKGQYLIFESGVLNVRSHSGYEVTIEGEQDGAAATTENNPPQ